jgi:hypothetical protein
MEVQPTKSSAKATTKNMSEKEKKYVAVLKELGLENDCTVEAYLRAYVNHLAAELEDKVERQVQAFQNRFEEIRKEMEEDSAEEEEEEEVEVVEEQKKEDTDDKKTDNTDKEEETTTATTTKKKPTKKKKKKKKEYPKLVFRCIEGPYSGKKFVTRPRARGAKVLIGRSSGKKFRKSGVSLSKDQEVSTNHGRIDAKSGSLFYVDTQSSNGSRINNEWIEENTPTRISSGDILDIGACKFVLDFDWE